MLGTLWVSAQELPRFAGADILTNHEIVLRITNSANTAYRIEGSLDLVSWSAVVTLQGKGSDQFTDSQGPFLATRFYRTVPVEAATAFTGDHIQTTSGDAVVHPVNHASFVIRWNGLWIYNDPVGGATPYKGIPQADIILVSHAHSDHFDAATLNAVKGSNTVILAPAAVYSSMSAALRSNTIPMAYGATTNRSGAVVEAVPAYNANHPKGSGNGFVLTLGGVRFYMSGDTGDVAEMRALKNIDVAFLCMNQPFTMTIDQAAGAAREFRPRMVYPYHFRNSNGTLTDLNAFQRQVGFDVGVEVRKRKWY